MAHTSIQPINDTAEALLREQYGYLFEEKLMQDILKVGQFAVIPEGNTLIEIGQAIIHMPLLLEGAIKILREDKEGNELLLYYLEHGDTCMMSMTCCMGQKKSKIRAVAEETSKMILIPVEYMDRWLNEYPSWKSFVFESYQSRMDEFLETIDSIAFMNMDERLLKYLTDKAKVTHKMTIENTHQEIAYDLHTSRVVISRLLKQLENAGKITLHRNRIELLEI
ncbi:MAG: Crp/Fnr family transcriptional regulator [Bacteroidia bacterium]|nr:Crp/Fnr family transcriptional regulator [Bacteroidia bacterium]